LDSALPVKRAVSELQPAAPKTMSVNAAKREHERDNATREAMGYSLIRNITNALSELTLME
jgi:hypothetical protein